VIHGWTVNNAAYALRLWRAGVQGILSDDPRSILAARKSA
jgi:glycerophosphoryl diester phosphodiesterase